MQIQAIINQIKFLKEKKNAIILAHNYQELEIQKLADHTGDSLQLSQIAAELTQELVVFCGVRFMAETAKLLKPNAKVLLPVIDAGCPMADMITGEQLREFKKQYPDSVVVCYVNSSVEVKAESDICCTSGNAIKIVRSIPKEKQIIFVPDRNLGSYASTQTGRNVILWQGFCNVHDNISAKDVLKVKEKYPGYKLIVHPECKPEVVNMADEVGSTKGIIDYVSEHNKVIIGTETGLYYQLKDAYPNKELAPISENTICVNMKKTHLKDVLRSLEKEEHEIFIPQEIASMALNAVEQMLKRS